VSSGTDLALLSRWDGDAWTTVAGPRVSPPEADHGYLQDVTCVTASDCWAVGFYFSGQVARSLTMHWNGSAWSIVDSPNSAPGRNNYLGSVTCTSATDCWTVGRSTTTTDTERQPLILRWDGQSWSVVSVSPADTSAARSDALEAVSCVSPSECMAVGHSNVDGRYLAFAMRWNGTDWLQVPVPLRQDTELFYVPSDILYDVSCAAAADCWAAGAHWTGTVYQTLVAHWDGTTWTPVVSPSTGPDRGNILSGVSCVSTTYCWAVGSSDDYEQALVERWDGTSWSIVPAPQTGSILTAVACVSTTECWAVGPYYTPHPRGVTLLARWDGTSWTTAASPGAGTQSRYLSGIACASSSECWAVGRVLAGSRSHTLALRYQADDSPAPTVPQGQPWLMALAGVLLLAFAARRRRSFA
jgi:MYXO-CTERM domain-containing protein